MTDKALFSVSPNQLSAAYQEGISLLLDMTVETIRAVVDAHLKKLIDELPRGIRENTAPYTTIQIDRAELKGNYAGDQISQAVTVVTNQLQAAGFKVKSEYREETRHANSHYAITIDYIAT